MTVETSKLEDTKKLIPEEIAQSRLAFNNNFKKGNIICSAWLIGGDGNRDKFIGSVKRKVGHVDFVIKGKRYFIDYNFIKEGKKAYYYDCDVRYSNAPLPFHKLADNDARLVIASQADAMLIDGVVRVLMGKGGIPAMYLLIAMIITGIAVAGLMYFLNGYQTFLKENETLKTQKTNLTTENNQLKQQIQQYQDQLGIGG